MHRSHTWDRWFKFGGVMIALLLGSIPLTAHSQIVRSPELNAQYHRAETAWRSGTSMLEAKARVDRVIEELPDDVAARELRARVLLEMNRPQEALDDARRVAEAQPQNGEAFLLLCEAARRSGKKELALEALDRASELVLDDAELHVQLSWNAALLDRLDRAEAFARVALALDNTEAAAYYQLARVFTLQDQLDDAATVLARGFNASVLNAHAVLSDSVLTRVASHDTLRPFMKQ